MNTLFVALSLSLFISIFPSWGILETHAAENTVAEVLAADTQPSLSTIPTVDTSAMIPTESSALAYEDLPSVNETTSATEEAAVPLFTSPPMIDIAPTDPNTAFISQHNVEQGICGETMEWVYYDDTNLLVIYGSGNMDNFGYNGQPWFPFSDTIQTIEIADGITSIGNYAFAGCSCLKKITIPDSITKIGKYAFYNCTMLSSVTLPDNISIIETALFHNCKSLTKIRIPDSVISISSYAFEGCTNLQYISIPSGVQSIGNTAFAQCSSITKIELPESLCTLGGGVFYECTSLSDITIPPSISEISDHTFYSCYALNSIVLPVSISSIGYYAFYDCINLSEIYFTGNAPFIDDNAFPAVHASSFYPGDNSTWNIEDLGGCGGTLLWEPILPITIRNSASSGKPFLEWEPISNAVSYQIYRSQSKNGPFRFLYTTQNNAFTNIGAEVGIHYYYKIKVNFPNGSAFSKVVSRVCDLPRPVVATTNVSTSGKIKITWDPISEAESYEVYRASDQSGPYTKMLTTTKSSYINTSAIAGKTYYYKVKAIHSNQNANSSFSSPVKRTCDLACPVVKASNIQKTGKIKLTWESVLHAEKYYIYRSDSRQGPYKYLYCTSGTSFTNLSTTAGQTYYYKVKAIHSNSYANSAYSEVIVRTCDLARPTVSISLNQNRAPQLTWNPTAGAIKYEIYRAQGESGEYQLLYTTDSNRFTNISANSNTIYYYKIRAVHTNSSAKSAFSTPVSIKT